MGRKAGSIPAVPASATGEMHALLQALRQRAVAAEEELASAQTELDGAIADAAASASTDLTALAARVTTAEGEIDTLQTQVATLITDLDAAEAQILLRADKDQAIAIPLFYQYPEVTEKIFFIDSPLAFTITKVTAKLSAGTATIAIQIENTNMNTGTMAVTTSQSSESPTSANTVAAGNDLSIDISAVSGAEDLSVMIWGTIVLA